MTARTVSELVLADEAGVWAIRAASETVFFVDLEARFLLRQAGPTSSRGPGDERWVPLMSVSGLFAGDSGVIRVGDRHAYLFDWNRAGAEFGFWVQRLVTAIDYVEAEELATLPALPQGDPL